MSQNVSKAATWLQHLPSEQAAARVFCIPHAGSGTSIFGNWPASQGRVEFLPVELPGRLTRFGEPMPETFQELATAMIADLEPWLDRPFAFFGHCWSALVAYEATAQVQRGGRRTAAHLFVSSQVAPQDGPVGRMLSMTDAELVEELEATIRAQGRQPHPELLSVYTTVLRADVEVSRRYVVPEPIQLSCPITAIGWMDDTEVRAETMSGWRACGETTFKVFPGPHHRFIDAPPELLSSLQAALEP
jgi:surfactin synthase thioesterase subunit